MSDSIIQDDEVIKFYDTQIDRKLLDFIRGNERVERAWQTLLRWSPSNPKRILEIGCGVGYISWRMSKLWPTARVVGLDLSPATVAVASKLFSSPHLSFIEGPLATGMLEGRFDLIVLIDVYEHIKFSDRPGLHAALNDLLSDDGRIFLAFPTICHLEWLKEHKPSEIQPVDEDVDVTAMAQLAKDSNGHLLLYQEVSVWNEGDYAHVIVGKRRNEWRNHSDKVSFREEIKKLARFGIREMTKSQLDRIFPSEKARHGLIQEKLGRRLF